MRQILFAVATLLVISFFSCEKEGVTPQEGQSSLYPIDTRSFRDFDAQITIQASMYHSVSLLPRGVSVRSFFNNSKDEAVDIGSISVEGFELKRQSQVAYYDLSANDLSGDTLETLANAFQNKAVNIQFDGGQSVYEDLDTIVPLPSMIVFEEPIDSIDKSEPLTLRWKNGGDNSKEPVGVFISYNPHDYDNANSETALPDEAAYLVKIIHTGNKNSVTITRKELSRFTTNGNVDVKIGRGVQTFIEQGGKTFRINGLNHSGWFDVVVYDSSE